MTLLLLSFFFLLSIAGCKQERPETSAPKKWNVLLIWTDQQRFDTMEAYGNNAIKTPNFNRLASESFVFKKAYVTQPVCSPSRASILTGLYPHTHGTTANNIPLAASVACLPELLADSTYRTAYMGKWHLGNELFAQQGFQEWVSYADGYNRYFSADKDPRAKSDYHHWLLEKGYKPDITDGNNGERFSRQAAAKMPLEHTKAMFLQEQACAFLEEHRDQPFVLSINFFEPHNPFFGPLDSLHNPDEVTLPPNLENLLDSTAMLRDRIKQVQDMQGHTQSEASLRNLIVRYWGLVSLVDRALGNILDKLEELGLEERTIIAFTSDHGEMLGSHLMTGKGVMYEAAVRVPFLIKAPHLDRAPRQIETPVSLVDLMPTLQQLAGKPISPHLQGNSLMPLMEGSSTEERPVFIQWNRSLRDVRLQDYMRRFADGRELLQSLNGRSRAVVSPDGWKLVLAEHDKNLLFNLNEDPYETRNLYHSEAHQDVRERLTTTILQWQQNTQDTVPLSVYQ